MTEAIVQWLAYYTGDLLMNQLNLKAATWVQV